MANPADYQLLYSKEDIEALAAKLRRQSPTPLSTHDAYIKAVRLLGNR